MPRAARPRWLVGSTAHNLHIQHIVRALHEADALYEFDTGGVDSMRSPSLRRLRQSVSRWWPALDRQLNRRRMPEVPEDVVRAHWGWELPRILASRVPGAESVEDWLWEREELALDGRCARGIGRAGVGAFFGVEHGALASLQRSRSLGKPGIVAFLSPHHLTRAKWVDVEFAREPALLTPGRSKAEQLAARRDARRDREVATALWVETGSSFVTRSLVDAGVSAAKILTVPMGGPDPVPEQTLPVQPSSPCRVAFVGPVSARKGAHHLLRAWGRVSGRGAALDLYGKPVISDAMLRRLMPVDGSVTFHGSVPARDLHQVYLQSSVLVLPTLCDGFGMVVAEALAHGLPVITTTNAGAADRVAHGKTGFIIPPADEDALARTLQWCIDHPDALHAMRRPALAAAADWTWADFRRRQIELLDAALLDQAGEGTAGVAGHAASV